MVVLGGVRFLTSEVPLYSNPKDQVWGGLMAGGAEENAPLLGPYSSHMPRALWWSSGGCISLRARYRGTSLIRNSPPPQGHHRALDIVELQGPTRGLFLMHEVPLYPCARTPVSKCGGV